MFTDLGSFWPFLAKKILFAYGVLLTAVTKHFRAGILKFNKSKKSREI